MKSLGLGRVSQYSAWLEPEGHVVEVLVRRCCDQCRAQPSLTGRRRARKAAHDASGLTMSAMFEK